MPNYKIAITFWQDSILSANYSPNKNPSPIVSLWPRGWTIVCLDFFYQVFMCVCFCTIHHYQKENCEVLVCCTSRSVELRFISPVVRDAAELALCIWCDDGDADTIVIWL